MAFRSESKAVYEAVAMWAEICLRHGGSMFGEGQIWTSENFARLNADFVENLLEDDRSFTDKLQEQLEESPPEVKRLAAEMLWLMMLFPSNVSYDAKLRLVSTVHVWSGSSLPLEHQDLRALSVGVGSTGQAYNQHRWRELTLLVRAMIAWGALSDDERVNLLSDGWRFAAWLDRTPDAKNRQIRNILLHLLFPWFFERISSFGHKRLIVRHFAKVFDIPVPRESVSLPVDAFDRPLAVIRQHLEEMHPGRTIDFYDADIEAQWRPIRRKDDEVIDVPPGDPDALENRLESGLRGVVLDHLSLVSAVAELRAKPTLGLLASALMRSLAEDRRDTARALWEQINRRELPDNADSVQYRFGLMYARSGDWRPQSADADFAAILGSGPGQEVRPVLERADDCARQVSRNPAPEVSIRHLIGAILRPGPDNEAKRALTERGFSLDRLRAGVMAFFQSTLVADDLDAWREYLDVPPPALVLPEPGFARDYVDPEAKELGPDHLTVDRDVEALARLLCARSVEPPLSVGLFADWGTGKSTFMQRLKWNIGELSRRAESAERRGVATAFRSGVVPIWFNAWHYMDANLWASLVTRIFDQLARHLSGDPHKAALEEARKRLYARLAASQGLLAEAERRKSLAVAEAATAQERVGTARRRQESVASRIARARDVAAGVWKEIEAQPAAPAEGTEPAGSAGAGAAGAADPAEGGREDAVDAEAAKAVDAAVAQAAADVRQAVGTAARELGLRDADASIAGIRGTLAQMRGVWGNLSASAEILSRQRGFFRGLAVPLLGGLLLAAVVVGAIWYFGLNVREWVRAATGLIITLAPLVSLLAASAARVRRVLERADAEIQASTARAAAEADALQRELDRLKEAEAAAERDRLQAERTVAEIESEIEDIRAGRRLEQFIRDRAGSDDYRRHLGIIATIREDFERLQTLLDEVRKESETPRKPADAKGVQPSASAREAPAVHRIVLYIDDLDRCPEDRVVEVLQAVHLLLAFPLFVVVVGVDPRWLLRAVQSQYERLLANEREAVRAGLSPDEDLHWASTPQNYLEKIFQIPFTLEPMNEKGFGQLLGSLIKVRAPDPATAVPEPTKGGDAAQTGMYGADEAETSSGLDEQWLDDESPEEEEGEDAQAEDDAGLDPPGLEVEAWELQYLSGLAPLIGSPRMAKRFANVYRFIRASLSGPELEEFSGTAQQPGEFRAVSLLLALLTGFPGEAVELFRRLLSESPDQKEGWPDFVRRVAKDPAATHPAAPEGALPARRWARLTGALEQVEHGVGVAREMAPYRDWAPRVARFSFQTGQILARTR